jgi:flavin-dependent dehydrogenase
MDDGLREEQADVLILGGGVAGLSLGCQLKDAHPEMKVTVTEKAKFPVPAAAHKVGESTIPVAANYFYDVLGMRKHLDEEQLPKLGLRFFGSSDGNHDITRRPELGARRPSPLRSFQLDHGLLENALADRAAEAGVTVLDDMRATEVDLGDPLHTVTFATEDGAKRSLSAHWLVDASGRAAILKRKLGLDLPPAHKGQAAWFRISDRIAVDDWSSDPEWAARVYAPDRWLSTVHLHGRGYWVWLIPLASGSTSVGLVADPDYVPFERMRRFDVLLDWMRENEPQVAAEIDKRADLLQDFRTRKEYPRGARQVFSPDRWFITGDAGIFLDPLYSPGMDYISLANTFITEMITESRKGRPDMSERITAADGLFRTISEINFKTYEDEYRLLGNAEIMAIKLTWDTVTYFAFTAPVSFGHAAIEDPVSGFLPQVERELAHFTALNVAFRNLVSDWDELAGDDISIGSATACDEVMDRVQIGILEARSSEADIVAHVKKYLGVLDQIFEELLEAVSAGLNLELPNDPMRFENDESLLEFRLSELPKREGPAPTPATFSSTGALYWAAKPHPEGASNDHLGAWPSLGEGVLPPPEKFPYPLSLD